MAAKLGVREAPTPSAAVKARSVRIAESESRKRRYDADVSSFGYCSYPLLCSGPPFLSQEGLWKASVRLGSSTRTTEEI